MPARVPAPDGSSVTVLPSGTRLRRGYTLDFLAAGGMSVAYRALHDGETYFAKEVSSAQTQALMSLSQEKTLLERLDHPAIVKAHDLFEEDGHYYLVLDFIEGQSLEQIVRGRLAGFLSEADVRSWVMQLCDVLQYLHGLNPPVIYRDLKPRNVLRAPDGKVHLVDFGIARSYKQQQARDTLAMGTALTASPEHYGGRTDARSDIFSLGATAHYLLTRGQGERPSPFEFPPIRSINPDVSPDFASIIERCVQVKPAQRYQSAQELKAALNTEAQATAELKAEDQEPAALGVDPGTSLSPSPESWKNPWLGTLAVGMALGVIFLWNFPGSTPVPETPSPTSTVFSPSPLAVASPEVPPRVVATLSPSPWVPEPVLPPAPQPAPAPPPAPAASPVAPPPPPLSTPSLPPVSPPTAPPVSPPAPPPAPAPPPPIAPDLPSYPSHQVSERELLDRVGLPWRGVELAGRRAGSAVSEVQVGGLPLPVPEGYLLYPGEGLCLGAELLRPRQMRLICLLEIAPRKLSLDELVEARQSILKVRAPKVQVWGQSPLEAPGGEAVVLSMEVELPKVRDVLRIEEIFYVRRDLTISLSGMSSARTFPRVQEDLRGLLQAFPGAP